MKKIVLIVALFSLFACNDKEVKLPQASLSVMKDIEDHSPIYMFFDLKDKKDTIIEVNRKNSISSTNWVFNIDKRLPLKLVIPEVMKLQEKKKGSSHAKEGSINVFTYSDSVAKNLAFFPFSDVQYKFDEDFSKLLNMESLEKYEEFQHLAINFVKGGAITVEGLEVDRNAFVTYITKLSRFSRDRKLVMLHLNFDKELSYGDYIQNKILAWQATNDKVQIFSFEFIYDQKQSPEM
ncbi:hypothetical protein ACFSX9_11190 [Flavobacterium ardleyense]|uniref:Lipoprotein n=1 Tax=Flavobacterium ardleyense TaxID=2038737 RepID=A0ABW5ZB22_9FLAO